MSSTLISTHGVNMTQWCHEPGSLGKEGLLSGFSTNGYYFLFSTHSLIRRESFLLLLILLAPPYSLWDLSSLSRDFYFGSWWTIGFLQQGALER